MSNKYNPQPPIEARESGGTIESSEVDRPADPWLMMARDAYQTSTDWFDSNIRSQMERNLDNFHSRHPSGSKYHTAPYRNRSKLFRPKTRASERKFGAAVAKAFFGNNEVVSVAAQNQLDPAAVASSNINKEMLQYRLDNTIPWYLTLIGAAQDAYVTGIVISRQYWQYETQSIFDGSYLGPDGEEVPNFRTQKIKDQPDIKLIPIEFFRFDPGANWRDVVGTSPYLVEVIPMYLMEARRNMLGPDDDMAIEGKWRYLTDGELLSAGGVDNDSISRVREGRRADPRDNRPTATNDFDIVPVHRNIIKNPVDNQDYMYYTAGTSHMLSDPVPMNRQYPHLSPGERDYTVGFSVVESHKAYPSGKVQLTESIQAAANHLQNQRFDNVQLALNKRYVIRRGSSVDLTALRNSVPGGVYEVDDVNADIREEQTTDVTSSSYNEQDRLNADFDDLGGQFNSGSVSTNRQLGETVGGMAMLRGDADAMTEFDATTFGLTWATPALKQVMKLIQHYESDETLIMVAASNVQDLNYPMDQISDELLKKNLLLNIRIGTGATDPLSRVNNLRLGMESLSAFPTIMGRINEDEVAKEIFNAVGYSDGSRFLIEDEEGPSVEELMAQVEEMSPYYEEAQAKMALEQQKGEQALKLEQIRQEGARQLQAMKSETELTKSEMQLDAESGAKKSEIQLKRDELLQKMLDGVRKGGATTQPMRPSTERPNA